MEVLEQAYVTSPYGERNGKKHNGVDLISKSGNRLVMANNKARVMEAVDRMEDSFQVNEGEYSNYAGNYIILEHGNGYISQYSHLKHGSFQVKIGDIVEEGQALAEEGSSGYAFGVHLDYMVKLNGRYINPTRFGLGEEKLPLYQVDAIDSKEYLNLSPKADTWRIYPLNKQPVVGNECGFVYPSKFTGLSYTIIRYTMPTVAVIKTRDWGEVQIYIAHELATVTKQPLYGLVN